MDFSLSPEVEDLRLRIRAFVNTHIIPLESDPNAYDDHENIAHEPLEKLKSWRNRKGYGICHYRWSLVGWG